jgi:PIN domain nuclease of toxin-antitoxin system
VLRIPLAETRYLTDSSAVLGMLRTESGRFTKFMGVRVSEVKVNSNTEEE